ncbi:ADP-ribose pyrophosphatase, mitochondrial-like isoform X2 [Scyliorhinus canicula]|uniref:ADP-ribose pyrophosphatase, mitochondrial-like isoform X2 n=1 Tax=Scyliorhinus canicula TaxID=7830 RepID=UPI0018F6AEA8|nr:ADP-ribose pyrophosphatase, mitochondrial-like isoform X2 [Scyliorhinus canicula]
MGLNVRQRLRVRPLYRQHLWHLIMATCMPYTSLLVCCIWIRHSVSLTLSSWYKPVPYKVCPALHHGMGTPLMIHVKARSSPYPESQVERYPVPDNYVSWSIPWAEYEPLDYTADIVRAGPEWADPDFREEGQSEDGPRFNTLDGRIDRTSFVGCYELDEDKLPRNPMGRTGITSRGLLGKWGPNHAADPIVTRWKREAGEKGMVDNGELVSATLKREFGEEALDSLTASKHEKDRLRRLFQSIFSNEKAKEVFAGYVDDPRNTDSAWVETVATNFHDDTGDSVGQLDLQSGDDAGHVQWSDIDQKLQLYATHSHFLKRVTEMWGAHW